MYLYNRYHKASLCGGSCRLLGVLEESSSCKYGTVPQRALDNEGNLVFQCSFLFLLMCTHPVVLVSVHLTLAISGELPQAVPRGRKNHQ